ncbi:MAG: ATP-dependent sacrificial sulfur transferase LarE, partial [Actinomycetota bacterium]|nr:ATP-dependent sacrificial sulfur transferase LarE [Actinomycetota bacterium]
MSAKVQVLRDRLRSVGPVVVAFSGGADSAFLAWMAHDTLGPGGMSAVTAVSPSLAAAEREDCAALAQEWGLRWTAVETNEFANSAYMANGRDRCAHCKTELMDAVVPLAAAAGATVVLGVNVDDLGDHRPGQQVAAERGAVFPLVDAGFTKSDVREASRMFGLRTWDKPAAACLASRVPHGVPVTLATIDRVGKAEAALRGLGFR